MTIEARPIELGEQSLEELARIVDCEHGGAEQAASSWLVHAIRAGEALNEAKQRVPHGEWLSWLESATTVSYRSSRTYMRIATYRAELPPGQPLTRADAMKHLASLPNVGGAAPEVKESAKQLHDEGVPRAQIAKTLGVAKNTVSLWLNPELAARQRARDKQRTRTRAREAKRAQRALQEKEARQRKDEAARRAGGDIAEVYSLLRKLTAAVERAAVGSVDPEHARTLRSANHQLFRIEDDVVKILGVDGE